MAKSGTKGSSEYTGGLAYEIKRFHYYRRHLYRILGDTQKALKDVTHLNLFPLESSIAEAVRMSRENVARPPALVVLGNARARLINFLLGEELLPPHSNPSTSNGWRWLRLQHGVKRHVRLSFGTDFEIIEPNLSTIFNKNQITSQNLKRTDIFDLSTIMDIELCNPFLENGVQVLVPPDLGDFALDRKDSYRFAQESSLKNYETFFSKRGSFLQQVTPIVLYALDEIEYMKNTKDNVQKEHSPKIKLQRSNSDSSFNIFFKSINCNNTGEKSKGNSSKFYVNYNGNNYKKDFFESSHLNESTRSDPDKSDKNLKYDIQNLPGLSEESLLDLRQIYDLHPNVQILFVLFSDASKEEKDEEKPIDQNDVESIPEPSLLSKQIAYLRTLVKQLQLISNPLTKTSFTSHWLIVNDTKIKEQKSYKNLTKIHLGKNTTFKNKLNFDIAQYAEEFTLSLKTFLKGSLEKYMLYESNKLSEIHHALMQQFILSTFDMAREMQIIPRKIQYVAETEKQLYDTLNDTFTAGEKREELLQIMQKVLHDMKNNINNVNFFVHDSPCNGSNECINMNRSSIFYSEIRTGSISFQDLYPSLPCSSFKNQSFNLSESTPEELNLIDQNIADNVNLNEYCIVNVPQNELESAMSIEMDATEATDETLQTFTSTDQSSTFDLNGFSIKDDSISDIIDLRELYMTTPTCSQSRSTQTSFKNVSLEVQKVVLGILSRNISIQLVKFVDCLRDSYFGTLQRCLESLEEGHRHQIASESIKQILFVIRTVDLQQYASFSFLHAFVDQLKRFFQRLSLSSIGNRSCCAQSARWRKQIAIDTIDSLNPTKLTKLISSQLKERIRQSHEQFQSALNSLSDHHAVKLQQTEDLKRAVRKHHAPRFARLCLESTSLFDLTKHGVPKLEKEIGRGQYGVVFSVKGKWGGSEPCAVKSVVPPDDRHFNELAMEFFHTRNLPTHDRIVQLRGSVIDYAYEGGSPAVYLISERLRWDLHCALVCANLTFVQRMQIAIDIVEGIRYLHSQGLVHRDIKMKNVLLDEANRAKLTDLGFCIPEAMISGSVVGTPVHMAPELLSGIYDNSVDVYAFGILFWYICAGHVRLPSVFERFHNKDQLWMNVKKGLRPERLPQFSDACWFLMKRCWSAESSERPLLGDVQLILEAARDNPHFNSEFS